MGLCHSDGSRNGRKSKQMTKEDIKALKVEYEARVDALEAKLSELSKAVEQNRNNAAIAAFGRRLDELALAEEKSNICYRELVAALEKIEVKQGQYYRELQETGQAQHTEAKDRNNTEKRYGQLTQGMWEMKSEMAACIEDLRTAMQKIRSHTSEIARLDGDITKLKGNALCRNQPVYDKGVVISGAGCIAGPSGIPDYHDSTLMVGSVKQFPRIASDDPNDRLSLRPLTPGPASDNDLD
mmetsp:Transcript_16264/g.30741  ORF Transcript_16264/g.30741 Transcript_16264/m.30741 type:complete len:240 (-) Transcript_16264:155-874(-)|eukprot:CAMPEP_0167776972 /NCGR_PEP_ID=MMETSP0111_2-20121227/3428_1 /TAXON_ID=91324 /ORGANISM="Lotharella globosa, Strain CCCM811" /LENGTH=239 /DNA_ID=CAMNT_0007667091 /DNA_START=53 /DNA_END=772 /DNA_ORIENTATION=-